MRNQHPANKNDQIGQFRRADAQRIANAVHFVESARRQANTSWLPRTTGSRRSVRLGSISETWEKGDTADVTLLDSDGSPVNPEETFEAKNWFATVTVNSGTKKVACAMADGKWILIAAEC